MKPYDPESPDVNAPTARPHPAPDVAVSPATAAALDALRPRLLELSAIVSALADALCTVPGGGVPESLQALAQLGERLGQQTLTQLDDLRQHAA